MTSDALHPGYDTPVGSAGDVFDRRLLARNIYEAVTDCPFDWSCRIGVFGEWGSGKTSLCDMLRERCEAKGDVFIWLSAWEVDDTAKLWDSLFDKLVEVLKSRGAKVSFYETILARRRKLAGKVANITSAVLGQLPYVGSGLSSGVEVLREYLSARADLIAAMRDRMSGTRIFIAIDDLDRVTPSLLPGLLLSLRELLDLPSFVFVLPIDPRVISKGLQMTHFGYDDKTQFLEKVIDLGYHLAPPTKTQALKLILSVARVPHEEGLKSSLEGLRQWLPGNPRRIKKVARYLVALAPELRRHRGDEVDWQTLLVGAVLEVEAPDLLERIRRDLLHAKENPLLSPDLFSKKEVERRQYFKEMLGEWDEIRKIEQLDVRQRLLDLLIVWLRTDFFYRSQHILYNLQMLHYPHALTWKELDEFLASSVSDGGPKWIREHAKAREISEDSIRDEIDRSLLDAYGLWLERAVSTKYLSQHSKSIDKAQEMLSAFVEIGKQWPLPTRADVALASLLEIHQKWSHFTGNRSDKKIRKRELNLLFELCHQSKIDPLQFSAQLEVSKRGPFKERLASASAIRRALLPHLQRWLEEQFSRTDFDKSILYGHQSEVALDVLLDAKSPIWRDPSKSIRAALVRSSSNEIVRRNALWILMGAVGRLSESGSEKSKKTQVWIKHGRLIKEVWRCAIAEEFQFRELSELRQVRDALIAFGVRRDYVSAPRWINRSLASSDAAN
jgi:hypothetical protein